MERILIIGNSGAGKSWLSRELETRLRARVTHLDQLFWEPGGFVKERPAELVATEVAERAAEESWILEGVFGDLIEIAVPRATHLIFLDKSWEECRAALLERGVQAEKHPNLDEANRSFAELLEWASKYGERTNSRSQSAHRKLYDEFPRAKSRFTTRAETARFLEDLEKRH